MAFTSFILLAIYAGVATALFAWADRRFSHCDRLPMQWSLGGRPNWYAPRRVALGLTPMVSGIGFLATAGIVISMSDPGPDSSQVFQLLIGLALLGLGVYAGYLWFVVRWDRAR